jgi:hypothetical protein
MKGFCVACSIVTLLAACATARTPAASGDAKASTAPEAHEHAGHDMATHGAETASLDARKRAEIAFLFPGGDDKGWSKVENGSGHHMAPEIPLALIPAAVRAEMLRQLALTLDVVKKYPTVKAAEAAGYRRAGPFIPGLGTHYIGGRPMRGSVITDAEILAPATIIFDGTTPDAPIAGFMYMARAASRSAPEPEGFAGPNDKWHFHTGVCTVQGANNTTEIFGFDGSITEADCRKSGGNFAAVTQYMLHVWTVPGYTSPLGVYSHANPALTCPDGTYHTDEKDPTKSCRKQ